MIKRYKKWLICRQTGFTLIELIVALSITTILGLIFTDTIIQTLRGQARVRAINQVKQNGQVVLEKIINEIREASSIQCVGRLNGAGSFDNTLVIYKGGEYSRYRYYPPTSSTNGSIDKDILTTDDVVGVTSEDLCVNAQNTTTRIPLTDTNTLNGVSIATDSAALKPDIFLLNSKVGFSDSDAVIIRFRAFPGVRAGSMFENVAQEGGVLFTTSVKIRGAR